ncbi:MAG: hypothetical protein WEC81_01335 [Patescibacteria group bacterium]
MAWLNLLVVRAHAYTINVPIASNCGPDGIKGVVDGVKGTVGKTKCTSYGGFSDYFLDLINYAVNIAFGLATLVIIFGAFKYVTSGGDDTKAKEGKDIIVGALIGLALLLLIKVIVPLVGLETP